MTWAGNELTLDLPAATGGDGALSYALSPGLPPGLAFDSSALRVSGTPTEAVGPTELTLSATDEDGDTATLSFTIRVDLPVPPCRRPGSILLGVLVQRPARRKSPRARRRDAAAAHAPRRR